MKNKRIEMTSSGKPVWDSIEFCNHKTTLVGYIGRSGVSLYASTIGAVRGMRIGNLVYVEGASLLVNLTGIETNERATIKAPEKLSHLLQYASTNVDHMSIDWEDGAAPPLSFEFWRAFQDSISSYENCIVYCIGGHGRTGTFVACSLLANGDCISGEDAIQTTRLTVCHKCIETREQVEYIHALARWYQSK